MLLFVMNVTGVIYCDIHSFLLRLRLTGQLYLRRISHHKRLIFKERGIIHNAA